VRKDQGFDKRLENLSKVKPFDKQAYEEGKASINIPFEEIEAAKKASPSFVSGYNHAKNLLSIQKSMTREQALDAISKRCIDAYTDVKYHGKNREESLANVFDYATPLIKDGKVSAEEVENIFTETWENKVAEENSKNKNTGMGR